jgi:hypothetical protein
MINYKNFLILFISLFMFSGIVLSETMSKQNSTSTVVSQNLVSKNVQKIKIKKIIHKKVLNANGVPKSNDNIVEVSNPVLNISTQNVNIPEIKNPVLFVWCLDIDPSYVFGEKQYYVPGLEKTLIEHNFYIQRFKKYASNKKIVTAINPIILDFINKEKGLDEFNTMLNKDVSRLTNQDKEFILKNFFIVPEDFSWDDFVPYKLLAEKAGYGINVSSQTLSKFSHQDIIDTMVWFSICWSGEDFIKIPEIKQLMVTGKIFNQYSLKLILNKKRELIANAIKEYKNFSNLQWDYVVFPYYDPMLSLISDNNIKQFDDTLNPVANNLSKPMDVNWQIAKSFSAFRNFYNIDPKGFISSLGILDDNVLRAMSLKNNKIFVNRGLNYESSLLFTDDVNSVYMVCGNVAITSFNPDGVLLDKKDVMYNFAKDINSKKNNSVVIVGAKYFDNFSNVFFKELDDKIHFASIDEFRIELDTETQKKFINTISVKDKPYVINLGLEKKYINEIAQINNWDIVGNIRNKVEEYQNQGKITYTQFIEAMNLLYKLESKFWYEPLSIGNKDNNFSKQKDLEFNNIISKVYNILGMKYETQKLDLNNNIISEYSDISYSDYGFDVKDSTGDDYGLGSYVYPNNPLIEKGSCDINTFSMRLKTDYIEYSVKLEKLSNPFNAPLGFSIPQIDIYIDLNNRVGFGNTSLLPGRNAFTKIENAWEYAISINGWGSALFQVGLDDKIVEVTKLSVSVDRINNRVIVNVPKSFMEGDPLLWKYIVCVSGYDKDNNIDHIRYVQKDATDRFFGGKLSQNLPNIIDMILPKGVSQKDLGTQGDNVEIPAISIKEE